jgi:hypothetical protein
VTGTADVGKFGAYNDAGATAPSNCASYSGSTITGTVGSRATTGTSWSYAQLTTQSTQDSVINVGGTYFETSTVDDPQPNAFYPKVYKNGSTTELVPNQLDNQMPISTSSIIGAKQNTVGDAYVMDQTAATINVGGVDNVIQLTPYTVENVPGTPITVTLTASLLRTASETLAPGKYTIDSASSGLMNTDGDNMVGETIYVFSDYDDVADAFGINSLIELQMVD